MPNFQTGSIRPNPRQGHLAIPKSRLFLFPHYICNNRCRTCFLKGDSRGFSYSLDELKHHIDSSPTPGLVAIGGGEPALYKHLNELIEYCNRNKKIDTQMFSNGTQLSQGKCSSLKASGLDSLIFTFHSNTDIGHDYVTGRRGSFKDQLAAVESAQKADIRFITAQILLHCWSYNRLVDIVKLCLSLGISRFSIQNLIPTDDCPNAAVPFHRLIEPIEHCLDYLDDQSCAWYSNSLPKCIVPTRYWEKLFSLTNECEYSNISTTKSEAMTVKKEYGLCIHSECYNSCPHTKDCPGTWRSYWQQFPPKTLKGE